MTLPKCRACAHGVSRTATRCPQCGAAHPLMGAKLYVVWQVIVLAVALSVMGSCVVCMAAL